MQKRSFSPRKLLPSLGFTLIELMVTLAIAAILATLAAPSFQDFVIRNKTSAIANEFSGSVLRARNEAVTRNSCTTLCLSTDGATCAQAGANWAGGWILFMNPGCDPAVKQPNPATDMVLVVAAADASYSLNFNGAADDATIFFFPSGGPRPTDVGSYDLQYQSSTRDSNRSICLSALGRTQTMKFKEGC